MPRSRSFSTTTSWTPSIAAASSTSGTSCFATRCIESVPAGDRRRFHARAAEFGGQLEGSSTTHASMHFERAGMTAEAFRTALDGRESTRCGSRRIGRRSILLRRAVDNMPASLADSERARILLLFADADGNIDSNAMCRGPVDPRRRACTAHREPSCGARSVFSLSTYARREGVSVTTRRDRARSFLNEIEAAPPGQARDTFRPYGLYALAQVELDDCRFAEARALLAEAARADCGPERRAASVGRPTSIAKLDVIDGRVAEGLATIRAMATRRARPARKTRASACIAMSPCSRCGPWTTGRHASGSRRASGMRNPSNRRLAATASAPATPSCRGRKAAGMTRFDRAATR